MATVTIEIPDELVEQFQDLEEIRRTVYEDFIIEQRQQGKLSLGEAAKLLHLTYTEFFELLGKKGLSFINATSAELHTSYQTFQQVMKQVTA